ncbi:hypothetical protein NRB56_08110 [Nocardia sp. RB56]|uniref:Uncharacterized protein n=1 Tax=Nocardia aurantia TaxID=2585199 RepID=A0A7K0DHH1_9NOCA|nr:hypothetical protein [Nocardia aurantia]
MSGEGQLDLGGVDAHPGALVDRLLDDHGLAVAGARRQRLMIRVDDIAGPDDAERITEPPGRVGEDPDDLDLCAIALGDTHGCRAY